MKAAAARAVMILTTRCLGKTRHQWARAMQIEFEAAAAEGKQLPFAIGCFIAACREIPAHREGRLSLANHVLALGFLVPMAAAQFLYAGSLPYSADVHGMLGPAGTQNPYLAGAQLAAVPSLLFLWFTLGAAHLRLAWVVLERDWSRAFNMSAMIVAGTATLAIYTGVLFLDDARLILHAAAIAVELVAVSAAARWHGISATVLPEELAR